MRDIKRSLAVVIGINEYSNGILRLETAVNDAQDLAELLRDKYGYQVLLLLNQDATQSRLNDLLAALTQKILPLSDENPVEIKRDDRLLFFFAGHGFASDVQNNTDGLAGHLVPQDGQRDYSDTWVSMQRLHDSLTQLPCRHLLVILDCCFAGSFRWAVRDREAVRREKLYRERYEQYVSGIAQQVITSADHDETAADSPYSFGQRRDNISGHSPFAELLLKGLNGEADYTKDNIITATELFLYLESELPKTAPKQTPKLSPLKRHDKGNYIFPLPDFDRNLLLSHPKPSESEESAAEDNNKLSTKILLNELLTLQQLTLLLGSSGWGRSNLAKSRLIKHSTLRDLSLKYIKILTASKKKDQAMNEEDREDSGQLTQSLIQSADWEYEQLVGRDRAYANTIRNVMLRMVALDGGELARRRVPDDELVYLEPENTRVKQVIARFCNAGLLVRRRGTEGNGYVEPVDDILVEEWSKVLLWKQQELRNLLLQRELTPIALQWETQKQQDKQAFRWLWNNDPRLPLIKQICEEKDTWLNAFESEFFQRSIQQRRRKRRRIIVMMGGAIASLYALSLLALYQLEISRLQEKAELVKTLLPAQPLEALLLAIQTMGENKSWLPWNILKPVEDSLKTATNIARESNYFQVDKGIVNSVAISPDNKTIAAGISNGKLYLWKFQERPTLQTLAALNNSINSVAFSPKNSNIIVAGSSDGKLRLWNLQGQPTGKTLAAHKNGINSVVFSPDGNTIVTGGGDGQLRLWKLQGQPIGKPLTVGKSGVSLVAVMFNRKINSTIVVSGSLDGKVSLWNVKQGKQIKAFFAHKNGVTSVSFSPNGQTIITGGGDGQVSRWNWGGQQIGKTFTANEFAVTSVAFIDRETIISSSMTVQRWNLQGKQIDPPFRGHSRLVKSIAISRDRQLLVTGGDDGKVKLWDLQSQQKNGLQIACDRLQYHPVSTNPKTSLEKAVKATCQRSVWHRS
jgi:WD40 repeat protein